MNKYIFGGGRMKIFNCILGVFAVLGAVYCIFFPGMGFLHAGWIMTMLMGGWGICAMFDYAQNRKNKNGSSAEATMGIVSFVMGVAAAAVSVIGIFVPAVRLIVDVTILWMLIGWFLCIGVSSVIGAVSAKKLGVKSWWFTLILGILTVVGAFYGTFHQIAFARGLGYALGALLTVYAVRLFCSVAEKD